MSIKGIDTQIMITRAADFARDNSALLKKPELNQDYLAVQAKAYNAQEKKRIVKTTEIELKKLRPEDGGGGNQGGWDGDSRSARNGREDVLNSETLVPPGDNMIDIRV